MFKLVEDWQRVVTVSVSFWMQALGMLLLGGAEAAWAIWGYDYDPLVIGWTGWLLLWFGMVGRVIRQPKSARANWLLIVALFFAALAISTVAARAQSPQERYAAQEAAVFAIWLPYAERAEGMRLVAYLDPVGIPTICAGSTAGVRLGMRMTLAQCRALFERDARAHRSKLFSAYATETLAVRLPPSRDAAFSDFAFNAGVGAAAASTAMRRLNAGDVRGACKALTWWDKAGGKRLRGLVARVSWRAEKCLAAA